METAEVVTARRVRLKEWIERYYGGSQAEYLRAVNAKAKLNQGELSGLLGNKSFGEKKAAKLERITPQMPEGHLVRPLEAVEEATGDEALGNLRGDVLYLRAVLNIVMVSLVRSTPAAADRIHATLAELPGNQGKYAAEALRLVREALKEEADAVLSSLDDRAPKAAKKTSKQGRR